LQEKERKAYVMGVQRRMAEYQAMGYTIERAKELQKTFQALNKMGPKERMKQAAKQRAMLGAMGMGAEGAELFNLQVRYRTMSADDKAKADKRMAQIQSKAAGRFGAASGAGAGLGQSMAMQMMAERTGFAQVAETFETVSGEGLKFDKQQLDATHEINETIKTGLKGLDYWSAGTNSAVTSIATNMVSGFASLAAINAAGFAISGMAGALGAHRIGKIGKGFGKGGGKAAGKGAAGIVGKGLGKSLLKKIPGLGVAAGLGFGASRMMEGDFLGGFGEVGSGLASLVPGVGTAASVGIDAWLAKRDLDKAAPGATMAEEMMAEKTGATPEYDPSTVLMELSETMKSLNNYLQANGEVTNEQAKTIKDATKTMNDAMRVGKLDDSRAGG